MSRSALTPAFLLTLVTLRFYQGYLIDSIKSHVCSFQGTFLTDVYQSSGYIITLIYPDHCKATSFLTALPGWSGLAAALGSLLAPLCSDKAHFPCPYLSQQRAHPDTLLFFFDLAPTCSPTPSPVQYHRPFKVLTVVFGMGYGCSP